jgi:hypothetical protein
MSSAGKNLIQDFQQRKDKGPHSFKVYGSDFYSMDWPYKFRKDLATVDMISGMVHSKRKINK